jgi:putative hydrolase of the HAD superfamily
MQTTTLPGGGRIAAVLFEPYGTLIDIETDERDWYAYLNLSRFLEYRGVRLSADELRWLWFEKAAHQLSHSAAPYPDFDARAIWREIVDQNVAPCSDEGIDHETLIADVTVLHRALTRRALRLLEDARPVLKSLRGRVRLGIVTDGQPDYVTRELRSTGIDGYFGSVVTSGARGYRKPDARLFHEAMEALAVTPEETLFVGVDTGRDVRGAHNAGIRSVLVLTRFGSKDIALGEPDYVVDQTGEIAALISTGSG